MHPNFTKITTACSGCMALCLVTTLCLFWSVNPVSAQLVPYSSSNIEQLEITPFFLKDTANEVRIADFAAGRFDSLLIKAKSPYLSFGDAPSPWWQSFQLQHNEDKDKTFILWFRRRNVDTLQVWHQWPNDSIVNLGTFGVSVHDPNKFFLTNGYYTPITLKKGLNRFFIKTTNRVGTTYLSYEVLSATNFKIQSKYNVIFFGVFAGVVFISLIFSVLMFLTYNEKAYLFYALYVLAILMREAYNYAAWIDLDCSMQRHGITLFFGASFGLFLRYFLKLWEFNKYFDAFIRYYCSFLYLLIPVFAYVVDDEQHLSAKFLLQFILLAMLFSIVLIISYTIYQCRRDVRAQIVLLAYLPLGAAAFLNVMRNLNLIPNYPFLQHSLMIGFILEVSIFSFAFVRFYRSIKANQVMLQVQLELGEKARIREVAAAENRVKEEIARDLHDDIAASVSGIRILSKIAKEQVKTENEVIVPLFDQINKNAQHTLENISDLIWTLRPNTDPLTELSDRIRSHTISQLENTDINYEFDIPQTLSGIKLDLETRRNILIVFKEALNNAVAHSDCKKITISLTLNQSVLRLSIKDDGKGFDSNSGPTGIGQGMNRMYARALEVGAQVRVRAQPNKGTEVLFSKDIITTSNEKESV